MVFMLLTFNTGKTIFVKEMAESQSKMEFNVLLRRITSVKLRISDRTAMWQDVVVRVILIIVDLNWIEVPITAVAEFIIFASNT